MRKLASLFLVVIALLTPSLLVATPAYAVDVVDPVCQNANIQARPVDQRPVVCQDNTTKSKENPLFGPKGILTTAISILSLTAGVIAVFALLIAGVKMITSSGESDSIASARRAVLYAVIALAIVGSAQAAVFFILSKLPGK